MFVVMKLYFSNYLDWLVGRALTRFSLEQEVLGRNLGTIKSDKVLPKARNSFDISSKRAAVLVARRRNCHALELANSLHASV